MAKLTTATKKRAAEHAGTGRSNAFLRIAELLERVEVTAATNATPLSLDAGLSRTTAILVELKSAARKVMLIGNGGSSAIMSHLQNDLSKSAGIRAMAFTDASLLTATANDHGFGRVFEGPIELWTDTGDVLVAVSSSGRSENILRGVRAARARGARVITLSGFAPNNPLRALGDINFYVDSPRYGEVEVCHNVLTNRFADDLVAKRGASGTTPIDGFSG